MDDVNARAVHGIRVESVSWQVSSSPGQRSSIGERVGYRPVSRRMRRDLILREKSEHGREQACLSERAAIGSRESGLPREIVRRRMKKPAEPDSLLSK